VRTALEGIVHLRQLGTYAKINLSGTYGRLIYINCEQKKHAIWRPGHRSWCGPDLCLAQKRRPQLPLKGREGSNAHQAKAGAATKNRRPSEKPLASITLLQIQVMFAERISHIGLYNLSGYAATNINTSTSFIGMDLVE
jgi:hypothetical protein